MIEVYNWRYEDATQPIGKGIPKGWYCNVYPRQKFVENDEWRSMFWTWMRENCPSSELNLRFNSGDLMFTVYIKDETEASIFQLRWGL